MYINLWLKKFGGTPKMIVFANFSKYRWFQAKQFTRLLEFIKPIREIFYFHNLPKLYIGFKLPESNLILPYHKSMYMAYHNDTLLS